ncbi:YdcF family protein [Trichothermofontia sichuanensis]|uniref:YdcF family protein n=1 Tax=Trichothermofontia sichuanensis TaxID=3045816 RepID=UPI00249E9BA1
MLFSGKHINGPCQRQRNPGRGRWLWTCLAIACCSTAAWVGVRHCQRLHEVPQAVLVLGGAPEREHFAAEFARQHPNLPIWVSSGTNPEYAEWVFAEAGIAEERLHLDYRAVDTVTNFTTLADQLQAQGVRSVYLITSDYHMRRAVVIGEIVLGSRGIHFQPVPVRSDRSPESPETLSKVVRDGARAILWVATGNTGINLVKRPPSY